MKVLKQMKTSLLPAGTRLKHGTLAMHLKSVFESGIAPAFARDGLRNAIEEAPKEKAVYVATLGAYIGAYRAFAANQYKLLTQNVGQPTYPVVLNICLREDCHYIADEDFVPQDADGSIPRSRLEEMADKVWSNYGSAAILREGGIPSSWIESFEYPQMLGWHVVEAGGRLAVKFWADVDLIVLSMGAPYLKHPFAEWEKQRGLWKKQDRIDFSRFSNRARFDKKSIEQFFYMVNAKEIEELLECCIVLESNTSKEIHKQGLQ